MEFTEFESLVKGWQEDNLNVLAKKSHDYAGSGGDMLSNFRKTAGMCNISPEKVFQVMLSIKLCRLVELLDGKIPKNESLIDTIDDSINYLTLCKALLMEKSNNVTK